MCWMSRGAQVSRSSRCGVVEFGQWAVALVGVVVGGADILGHVGGGHAGGSHFHCYRAPQAARPAAQRCQIRTERTPPEISVAVVGSPIVLTGGLQ